MDLIEDQNPVFEREMKHLAIARGEAAERRGGRIDQDAESTGEGRFAAGRGTSEHQDGVRPDGAEGGSEPGKDARARGVGYSG